MPHTQINSFFGIATKSLRHDSFTPHWWIHTSFQGFTLRTSHKWLQWTTLSIQVDMFALRHFVFTNDLHLYLFSLTKRTPKRISFLYKNRWKVKIGFGICFVWAITEVVAPQKWPNELTSPELHSHLSMKQPSPWSVSGGVWLCLHLFYASVSKLSKGNCFFALCYSSLWKVSQKHPTFGQWETPVWVSSSICISLLQVPSRSLSHILYL